MNKIGLNYTYLSPTHAGGKDQVGLNLLAGFYELGLIDRFSIICFEYSKECLLKIAPNAEIIALPSPAESSELKRLVRLFCTGTFTIPQIVQKYQLGLLYNLSCNTGFSKLPIPTVVIPHDIKAISHRVLSSVKVPLYKYWIYRIMYHMDFKLNDKIIAISEFDKKDITEHYRKFAEKIVHIYNPIRIKMVPRKEIQTTPYICALNIQFHHKNIITLIKAFELIKDEIPHNLLLIGKVPERVKYLVDYVDKNHLNDRIHFTGFIDDEEMYYFLANCSLYVNPSLYEGFGMTAIEAMIFEVPVLVSKIPANYEVTQGLGYYYEPADDSHKLADAIKNCLENPPSQDELHSIKAQMNQTYNYKIIAQQYYDFFSSLMNI